MSGTPLPVQVNREIDQYVDWMTHHGYSQRTYSEYKADLLALVEWSVDNHQPLDTWGDISNTAAAWLTGHLDVWKPNTVRRRMAAVRGFGKYNGVPVLVGYRPPSALPPTAHPVAEGRAGVIAMCEASKSAKQAALCALTGLCGLRVSEAISVRPADINEERRILLVHGKGAKQREVPIADTAWTYIMPALRRAEKHALEYICPYSNSGARRSIEIQGRRAALGNAVSSHDMRATFLTDVYGRTKDLRAAQLLAGHAQVTTTQNYIGVQEKTLRNAVGD